MYKPIIHNQNNIDTAENELNIIRAKAAARAIIGLGLSEPEINILISKCRNISADTKNK